MPETPSEYAEDVLAQLQTITDNLPVIISYLDRDLRFFRLNRAYARMFGRSNEEAIGKHLSEVAGEPHYSIAYPYTQRALNGERVNFDSRIRHQDGTLRDVNVTYTPVVAEDKSIRGFIAMVQDVTARKQAEAALLQAQQRSTQILESITEAFFALDQNWRFTYLNREAERLLARTRGELLGRSIWEEFPEAVGSTFDIEYNRARNENRAIQFEEFYPPLNAWFEVRAYPSSEGLSVYFQNINERKQAETQREQLLRDLEAERIRLQTIIENLPAGIVVAEAPSGRIVMGNAQVELILGHPVLLSSSTEKYGEWVGFHTDGRIVAASEWPLGRALRGETIRGEEYLYQRGDKTLRWIRVSATPVFDRDGAISGSVAAFFDIDSERRTRDAIRESQRQLSTVLANIPDVVARYGPDLRYKFISASVQEHTGQPPEFFFGKSHAEIGFDAQLAARWDASLRRVFETGERDHMDFEFLSPDGSMHSYSATAVPEFDADGKVDSVLTITHDVTDRKRAEAALTRQAEELVRSNANLQQFAYVTSHDLQEPLRSIASFAQLLGRKYRGKLDADADEYLEFMASGARRMKELIDSLLQYSRVVNVEGSPFAVVSMEAVLRFASMNLQVVMEEAKTTLTHGELPVVMGDQVLLVQLLQNILSNSVKYHKPGVPPKIHVDAQRDGSQWVISVQDNGIGIDPKSGDRIFGVFKRLHGSDVPGTGIGLAICQRIVEKHGGRIWLDPNSHDGATFRFTLPAI